MDFTLEFIRFKQSQYGRIILPFTLLRRLEGVLEESKEAVLTKYEEVRKMENLSEEGEGKLLLRATGGLSFFNISKMDLSKLSHSLEFLTLHLRFYADTLNNSLKP